MENKLYRVAVSFVYEIEAKNDIEAVRHTTIYGLPSDYSEQSKDIHFLKIEVTNSQEIQKTEAQTAPETEQNAAETADQAI